MIEKIHVRNFQSIHDVDIELGPLTVIVGPSSSGKSAFMRAVKTLTSNRRGTDFITDGERTASISAATDKGTVTLTRNRGSSSLDSYLVTPTDPQHPLAPQQEYKKLGGDVPPEVSDFLGIAPKDPINYADQFDKPYLLDTSAGEAARTLGALTNVSVIFEAARESNRRKLAAAATLRTRADDLQAIKNRVPGYRALKGQSEALTQAEEYIAAARLTEKKISRLTHALDTLDAAEREVRTRTAAAARPLISEKPILEAAQRLTAFRDALRTQQATQQALKAAEARYAEALEAQQAVEATYAEIIGSVSDDLHGWIAATATPGAITSEKTGGIKVIELDEAVRVFTLYIETKATS